MDINWEEAKEEIVVQYTTFSEKGGWIIEIASILCVAILLTLFLKRVLNRLSRRSLFQKTVWRHTCLRAFSAPAILAVWGVSISLIFADLQRLGYLRDSVEVIDPLRNLILVIALGWLVLRWKSGVEEAVLAKIRDGSSQFAETQVAVIGKLVTIGVVIITLLLALEAIHVDIKAIVAVGGIGGIAIGFAGKDVFSNFFSGFMIYATRPFAVGNWVRSPDRDIEGTVEHVGWYLTRIRTFDKRPIYVPNSLFSTIVVENPSRMTHRRIRTQLGLRYCDLPIASEVIEKMQSYLKSHPGIDQKQRVMVYLNEFGSSSIDILIYCFCKTTDWAGWLAVQQEVLLGLAKVVQDCGADFAFPTQTLDLPPIRFAREPHEANVTT